MTSRPVINFPDRVWIKNGRFIQNLGTPAAACLLAEWRGFLGEAGRDHFKTFRLENSRTVFARPIEKSGEVWMLEMLVNIADDDPVGAAATFLPGMIVEITRA